MPRAPRRYWLRIACGSANWLRSVLLAAAFEPAPVVGITPRCSEVPPVYGDANTARSPFEVSPPGGVTSPKDWQLLQLLELAVTVSGTPPWKVKNGAIVQPFSRWPSTPFLFLKSTSPKNDWGCQAIPELTSSL